NMSHGPWFSMLDLGMRDDIGPKQWHCIKDVYDKPITNTNG
ncbi:12537_t:CDS:1, partial [Dentiscutata erythropus]